MTYDVAERRGLSEFWAPLLKVGRVLIPSTFLASLFYYFGLRYTDDHYRQYGLDDAALGYSPVDYVLRSLNVTVHPVRVVAVVVLAAVGAHTCLRGLLRFLEHQRPSLGRVATRVTPPFLLSAGAVGFFAFWSSDDAGNEDRLIGTGWWFVSIIVIAYGAYLGWEGSLTGGRFSRLLAHAIEARERRAIGTVLLAMLVVLIGYGAFEYTRAYAWERALQQAIRTEQRPWEYTLVRLYSKIDLALDEDLGVSEHVVPGDDLDFRFRYDGLRLFVQVNGHIVLWPAHRSPRSGMFILTESADLRVEYEPDLR